MSGYRDQIRLQPEGRDGASQVNRKVKMVQAEETVRIMMNKILKCCRHRKKSIVPGALLIREE